MTATAQDAIEALQEHEQKLQTKFDAQDRQITGLRDSITRIMQRGTSGAGAVGQPEQRGPFEALTKSDGLAAFRGGARDSGAIDLGLSIKTLTSLQGATGSPAEGIDVLPERQPGLFGHAARPLTLLEALPARPIGSNALTFTRMVGYSSGANYQDGEGTTKPEQGITPSLITSHIATVAVWQDLSKQVLDDEPGLESSIEMLLRHGVLDKAEREVVAGTGGAFNISGLLTEAVTFVPTASARADRIGECSAFMASRGYMPDIIALSPADWYTIQSERAGGSGEYIAGGWASPVDPRVYGVRVVASAAVPAGTALVIDSRLVSLLDRQQATVEFSRESGNNFKQNVVTALAELRIGLAVYDQLAVHSVALT